MNECSNGTHDCHVSAYCINIPGSFDCSCNQSGYRYNGSMCVGRLPFQIVYILFYVPLKTFLCRLFDQEVKYITKWLFNCVWTLLLMTCGWSWEKSTNINQDKSCAIISKWTSSKHWLLQAYCINSQSRWWRAFSFGLLKISYLAWIWKRIVSKTIPVYKGQKYVTNPTLIIFSFLPS